MPLHRDIFWLGRQWAVTDSGIQAIDQKLDGKFDVEASRILQDCLAGPMQSGPWFDGEDFAKALSIARKRFQELQISRPFPDSEK